MASKRLGPMSAPRVDLDLLAALRPTSERHSHREKAALAQIEAFRKHLDSDKFKGTEPTCDSCGSHTFNDYGVCVTAGCGGGIREERKDWIATKDVLRWLGTIEEHLKYDMPAMLDRD